MSATESANRLNHRFNPGDAVNVRREGSTTPLLGQIVAANPDGSYGVRVGPTGHGLGTHRVGRIVRCRPIELTRTQAPHGVVHYRREQDRKAVSA